MQRDDVIAHLHVTGKADNRSDPAVGQHRRITSRSQIGFHAGTGRASARARQYGGANPKGLVTQRGKVDAGNDDVSAEQFRVHSIAAEQCGHDGEMFGLNQGDLPFRCPFRAAVMVAFDAPGDDADPVPLLDRRS